MVESSKRFLICVSVFLISLSSWGYNKHEHFGDLFTVEDFEKALGKPPWRLNGEKVNPGNLRFEYNKDSPNLRADGKTKKSDAFGGISTKRNNLINSMNRDQLVRLMENHSSRTDSLNRVVIEPTIGAHQYQMLNQTLCGNMTGVCDQNLSSYLSNEGKSNVKFLISVKGTYFDYNPLSIIEKEKQNKIFKEKDFPTKEEYDLFQKEIEKIKSKFDERIEGLDKQKNDKLAKMGIAQTPEERRLIKGELDDIKKEINKIKKTKKALKTNLDHPGFEEIFKEKSENYKKYMKEAIENSWEKLAKDKLVGTELYKDAKKKKYESYKKDMKELMKRPDIKGIDVLPSAVEHKSIDDAKGAKSSQTLEYLQDFIDDPELKDKDIRFHMHEGIHKDKVYYKNLEEFFKLNSAKIKDKQRKGKIRIGHSGTADVQDLILYKTHLGNKMVVEFNPTTYHELGEKGDKDLLKKQLRDMLGTKIDITFGSDSFGKYTCEKGKECRSSFTKFLEEFVSDSSDSNYNLTDKHRRRLIESFMNNDFPKERLEEAFDILKIPAAELEKLKKKFLPCPI